MDIFRRVWRLIYELRGRPEYYSLVLAGLGTILSIGGVITGATDAKLSVVIAVLSGCYAAWSAVMWAVVFRIRNQEPRLFISEFYAQEISSDAIPANSLLILCLLITIAKGDFIVTGIVGAVIVAIGGFGWLTMMRAEHGWFADNRYEVLELLHFIIATGKSGGFPPGSRATKQLSEAAQMSTSSEATVGSRV
jgi:hypothetical protein